MCYGGVVNDLEEGRRIGVALAEHKAVILQNHGLLTAGASVAEAAWWFVTMERSCQAQLLAMAAGTPKLIGDEVARQVHSQIGGSRSAALSFASLRARVPETDAEIFA
jgi:ribulose-5-phosphate 4-epimerase/fuculose-1-phosphate aldolase